MTVSFVSLGTPAPQGSKTPWGTESNPRTRPWRDTVAHDAREAKNGEPLEGPLSLHVVFWFPRPKSHFGTGRNAGVLKESAPKFVIAKPDLDKLVRAVGDALTTAGVWRDDSQAVMVTASKRYVEPGLSPSAAISVALIL